MCTHLVDHSCTNVVRATSVLENGGLGYMSNAGTGAQATSRMETNESVLVSLSSEPPTPMSATSDDVSARTALPEEIIIVILEDVITSESSACYCHIKDAKSRIVSSPRRFAQVSRTWRQIVFSCPALWKHVHLTPCQSVDALKDHLINSFPLPIHIVVHQWPFRSPIPVGGPLSITTLTAQLHSLLSPTKLDLMAACRRVQSITINATESSTFINFVLQTWTGRGAQFSALRRVSMNGNLCATWSRTCFFDGKNAPRLETLELTNVMVSHNAHRLPWGLGLNLTTLVWSAPSQEDRSLIISATLFHHVLASFPSLKRLEMHGQVLSLDSITPDSLINAGVVPPTHIDVLTVQGDVFTSPSTAFIFLFFFPTLKRLVIRGRSCTGPMASRTITHALNAFIQFPMVVPGLKELDLECVDVVCMKWYNWALEELERWKWRRSNGYQGRTCSVPDVRMDAVIDKGCLYTGVDNAEG